jgi:hypothetical protein
MIYCNDLLIIRFPTFWPIEAIHTEIADWQKLSCIDIPIHFVLRGKFCAFSYLIEKSRHFTILFVILKNVEHETYHASMQ